MPLEIKELHIRVTVNQPEGKSSPQQASTTEPDGNKDEKEAIINQCVEQVIDLLNNKKER
ncbi:MAG: DUF5908 family protein [Ginsengibacter sp.]